FSLAAGREFELTLTEPALEQAFIDGTAGSDTEFTAVDVVISDVGTITYDISFIEPNRGNELDAVVIFAVSLTTDGDFIITAEEAEIRSAALSLDVPPFLLATFNDNLVDSLDGQRFAAGQGREAVFTDIAFETGQVILTGRIESTE
ncbi:MAG: hypothetical protein ACFB51_15175, partial [Anaerolineae bacterium]